MWTRMKSGPSRRRTRPGAVVVVAGLLLGAGSAQGYRFFRGSDSVEGRIVGAADAKRWSPEVWGAGETLEWEIAPDPDFEVYFDSPEGVLPFLERAALSWASLPTADISWSIAGVGEASEEGDAAEDQRNQVFVDADADMCGGYAAIRSDRSSDGTWSIHECDMALCAGYAQIPEDLEPEDIPGYREWRRETAVSVLVHELGHCLGLAHAGAMSLYGRHDGVSRGLRHPRDPAMSYGWGQPEPEGLAQDDIVGASLLRPAAAWQESTGTISGTLHLADEPIPYAQIWALPAGERVLEDRIGSFSDASGEFHLEGLTPGRYALWAQPLARLGAHGGLVREEPLLDLDESISGALVRIAAASVVEGVEIALRQGRAVRPPFVRTSANEASDPANSIVGRWGRPCSGIRVRAAHPSSAVGPLWFARRFSNTLGDRWFGTSLTVEWESRAAGTVFDWAGAYRDWWWGEDEEGRERVNYIHEIEDLGSANSWLDLTVPAYRISNAGSVTRHELAIEWPESAAATLRFHSLVGACRGTPTVVCDLDGCELR